MLKQSDGERFTEWLVNERAVIDVLPRPIVVTAPNGEILLWDGQAEALYGWSAEEVIGCDVTDVLVAVYDLARPEEVMRQVSAGETWSGDFTVLTRDGDPVR